MHEQRQQPPEATVSNPGALVRSAILAGPGTTYLAQRGNQLRARSWRAEALLRMFENVLEVGENPDELIVYASLGKAARSWPDAHAIVHALLELDERQTLVLASGAAVGIIETGTQAPLVLSAVNNTVGRWSDAERFYARADAGQTMWGGLTAAAWQYIGRQGVLQGTYELFGAIARTHFGAAPSSEGTALDGRWVLTAGLGGMGSAQPISARMLGSADRGGGRGEGRPAGRHRRARCGHFRYRRRPGRDQRRSPEQDRDRRRSDRQRGRCLR